MYFLKLPTSLLLKLSTYQKLVQIKRLERECIGHFLDFHLEMKEGLCWYNMQVENLGFWFFFFKRISFPEIPIKNNGQCEKLYFFILPPPHISSLSTQRTSIQPTARQKCSHLYDQLWSPHDVFRSPTKTIQH